MKKAVLLCLIGVTAFATSNEGFLKGEIATFHPRVYPNSSKIFLGSGFTIDTKKEEPAIPAFLKIKDYPGEEGVYIIHFTGPIYEHQKIQLKNAGVKFHRYLPNYGYLVSMKKEIVPDIKAKEFIDWIGIYQPAYKVAPSLDIYSSIKDTFVVIGFFDMDIQPAIDTIKAYDGEVLETFHSHFGHYLKVIMPCKVAQKLIHMKSIRWIEEYYPPKFCNDRAQWVLQTWKVDNRRIWDKGIKGEGQIVSTGDSGINTKHLMFYDPAVPINDFGEYPNHRKIICYWQVGKATFGDEAAAYHHGTHTGCTITGDDEPAGGTAPYDGMAPKAKIFFFDKGDKAGRLWGYLSIEAYALISYPKGVRIMSNSWGAERTRSYNSQCATADAGMWNHPEFIYFFSGGNTDRSPFTGAPANAKNVIAVGGCLNGTAANNHHAMASRGPTADGRIKPDLVAPFTLTSADGKTTNGYISYDGTSMSCPAAAGVATLIRQYFTEGWYPTGTKKSRDAFSPTGALIKAMMINSCESDFRGIPTPADKIGWGRPNIDNVLYFPEDSRKLRVLDYREGLETGYAFSAKIKVVDSKEPFRVTLVWTDYPGAEWASPALVNDLDLEVISPTGVVYLGNVFENSNSKPGGEPDSRNPVENVFLTSPEKGEWKILVKAQNVPFGPQPFALVVTGALSDEGITSLTISDVIINDAGQKNPDGNWDPGEEVTIKVELQNVGDRDVNNVTATISTTSPYVTVSDNMSNYGNISKGEKREGDGFIASVVEDTTLIGKWIKFDMKISSDKLNITLPFKVMIGAKRFDYLDHNVGNVVLTVTKHGSIGFLDVHSKGSGFKYPKTSANWLYHASFTVGNSKDYVCDRFYPNVPIGGNRDWVVTKSPDGRIKEGRRISDQDIKAIFDDSGHPRSKKLWIDQHSYAWSLSPYNDFVILRYILKNKGTTSINGLYTGIIADFDMPAIEAQNNEGGSDKTRRLVYMTNSKTKEPYVGVKLLEPKTPSNLSLLENPVYVYQGENNVWHDTTLYKFLKGDISVAKSDKSTDWTAVVAAGPFNLAPNDIQVVAFAFIGGDDLNDLKTNADVAQALYDTINFYPGIEEFPSQPPFAPELIIHPNPLRKSVEFSINLPSPQHLSLNIYDILGRRVKTLFVGEAKSGVLRIKWNARDEMGRKLPAGIYFIHLKTQSFARVYKILLID